MSPALSAYLIDRLPAIINFLHGSLAVSGVLLILLAIFYHDYDDFSEGFQSNLNYVTKTILIVFVLTIILLLLLPSQDTAMEMINSLK